MYKFEPERPAIISSAVQRPSFACHRKKHKALEKVSFGLYLTSDWPIVLIAKARIFTGKFYKNNEVSKMRKKT